MSDYCPHCDDFSIDASRARRTENREAKEKPKTKGSKSRRGKVLNQDGGMETR